MILFSDIHGDLETLKQIETIDDEIKVCLGDLVAYGPQSRECVELAKKNSNIIFL